MASSVLELLCAERLSMITMSPGRSVGRRISLTYWWKISELVAPSMVMQALDPSIRMEEIMVVERHLPQGAAA
jgi:hypothetical protein